MTITKTAIAKIVGAGLLTCFVCVDPSSASLSAFSYFDQGVDGWNTRTQSAQVFHVAAGGNPGGYISATVPEDEPFSYFVAPDAYLGDQLGSLGGALRFQLRLNEPVPRPGDYGSVFLERDGKSIFHRVSMPANDWTAYDFGLNGASGWTWTLLAKQASDDDFRYFLSDLDKLYIERTCALGGNTAGDLDGVELAKAEDDVADVPEPSILALLAIAGGAALLVRTRRSS